MLHRDDGKVSKTLTLQPFGDKGDWYLGLDVKDSANQSNSIKLGLPLTGGELHTIKALSEVMVLLDVSSFLKYQLSKMKVPGTACYCWVAFLKELQSSAFGAPCLAGVTVQHDIMPFHELAAQ